MPVVLKGAWGKVALMPPKPENPPDTPLTRAIKGYLARENVAARALSLRIGPNETLIRKILSGESKHPRGDTLSKISVEIGVPVERLVKLATPAMPPSNVRMAPEIEIPPRPQFRDLPVYGTSAGSAGDGSYFINFGDVVDRVRRPAGVANNPKAYGFYVTGDSMEPLYGNGELLIADPSKPCRIGDKVNITVIDGDGEGAAQMAYVKVLVRRTAEKVVVKQFNPPMELTFQLNRVTAMHRILNLAEAMGI